MNNPPELYLVIFWEKSNVDLKKAKEIIINSNFELSLCSGAIDKEEQLVFIKQLYHESVTSFEDKLQRVGCNKIDIGIIKDKEPNYETCHTTRGFQNININIFNLKKKLRALSEISDGVHISDSKKESKHNLYLCFSKKYKDLLSTKDSISFNYKKFKDFKDVLSLMNESVDYVVQRNFHEIDDRKNAIHGDIDFLVKNSDSVARLINASRATQDSTRKLYEIKINHTKYLLDLRDVHENYYDPIWSSNILRDRKLSSNNEYYIPSTEDQINMLSYHALLHKFELKKEYLDQLNDLTKKTNQPITSWEDAIESLSRFLNKTGYRISTPEDKTVKLNPFAFKSLNINFNEKVSRNSIVPEHHARNFSKNIAKDGLVIHEKEGSIHRSIIIAGKTPPFDHLIIKLVQAKDNYYSSYLYNEHHYLNILGNKYAPTVFCNFISDGWYTLLMERLDGGPLSFLIEKKLINKKLFQSIKKQLYDVINILKEKGINHRDLRLENIFLTKNMKVKIIDFGLATSIYDDEAKIPKNINNSGDDEKDLEIIIKTLEENIID